MLDVARGQGDGLEVVDPASGVADLFLKLTVRGGRGILPRVHHPLGKTKFVTVKASGVFARQQQGLALQGHHQNRAATTQQALVLSALAIGEFQVDGLDLEDAGPGGDPPGEDAGFSRHSQGRVANEIYPVDALCCRPITAVEEATSQR